MTDIPKAYDPKSVDEKWYSYWLSKDFFLADPQSNKPAYCIVIPPPNVTGVLHMGHALVNTLQDILIRWKRMLGFEVLWVPGTDHAGISTQTAVEKHLIKTTNKRRKDFSREEFLKHVWQWKEDHEDRILNQLKKLGCSCDWSRLRFTMDEKNNASVRTMFKKLFDDKLIYRGEYLVNWDPITQTAIADDEVEYEERQSFLWYFKYPLQDGSCTVTIATTRPETMLGDTAVAVSPKDARYKDLIGKNVVLPITNRVVPIISDHFVDPEFGTGVVKITPAHDPNDYEMGIRHELPFINIMTPDGKINANGGQFQGLSMEECRKAIVKEMESIGLVEKIQPHINRVGLSYRSKAIVEPYMSKQWFVKMEQFAPKLRNFVKKGQTQLIPENWENTYFHWIDNLRDWCISRQLWWGHRIPIWYNKENPEKMICWDGEGEPAEVKANPEAWYQDDDVLDTWFSSGLWPFATLGWPEKTPELARFYPNAILITGHDILFFWVARMIFMGEYAMGQVPFPVAYLHGLIYGKSYWRENPNGGITYLGDAERKEYDLGKPLPNDIQSKWEKMSKTKGNVIDPLEIIEQYGTDAMRMAICGSPTQLREIDLDRRRFEEYKNFTNKIWNGSRFVFMNLEGDEKQGTRSITPEEFSAGLNVNLLGLEDRWILSTLNRVVRDVNLKLENYQFDQANLESYEFFWKDFCSYYVEIVKPVLFGKVGTAAERLNKQKLLIIVLCQTIRLIHPMAPFITEELFQALKKRLEGIKVTLDVDAYTAEAVRALGSEACIVSPYPLVIRKEDIDPNINETFDLLGKVIYAIRNIRGEMKITPGTATDIHVIGTEEDPIYNMIRDNKNIVTALVRTNSIEMHTSEPKIGFAAIGIIESVKIMIPLPTEMLANEKTRLIKEKEKLTLTLEKFKLQLDNNEFVTNAPPKLIEKHRLTMQQTEKALIEICEKLLILN